MILRRFAQHVKEQNWFAVGLDVLVVIVGIFLGTQVTEWNEARKNRQMETDILARLDTELMERESTHATAAAEEQATRQVLYTVRKVMFGIDEMRPITIRECLAIGKSGAPLLPEVSVAIIDELVATGRLDMITSPEVRSGISRLHQRQFERQTTAETYLDNSVSLLRKYAGKIHYNIAAVDDPDDEDGYDVAHVCDVDKMVNDQQFLNEFGLNVSNYAVAGEFIQASSRLISELRDALDKELAFRRKGAIE